MWHVAHKLAMRNRILVFFRTTVCLLLKVFPGSSVGSELELDMIEIWLKWLLKADFAFVKSSCSVLHQVKILVFVYFRTYRVLCLGRPTCAVYSFFVCSW